MTYEPDLTRLRENLDAISPQVGAVAVFDNGSANVSDIAHLVRDVPGAVLLMADENRGIAYALNRLADWANEERYEWLLTLDQDSVASEGMVAVLTSAARAERVGLVTPFIVDRNKHEVPDRAALPVTTEYRSAARKGALTSGALTNLTALQEVGGFDEDFFIDYVDYDLNQRLMLAGYRILRANRTTLLHEVGNACSTWLRVPRKDLDGRWGLERFYSFGHGAHRCYFKARNRIIFTRKYGKRLGITHEGIWQIPQQVVLTLMFERDRTAKLCAFLRGMKDGVRYRLPAEGTGAVGRGWS